MGARKKDTLLAVARRGVVVGLVWEEVVVVTKLVVYWMREKQDAVRQVSSARGWASGDERDRRSMVLKYWVWYGRRGEKANVGVGVGDRVVWCNHKHHPGRMRKPPVKIQRRLSPANASGGCSAVIVEPWKGLATATAVEDPRAEGAVVNA